MSVEIITKEDLLEFEYRLLAEIRKLLSGGEKDGSKQWLKSCEVRKLLKISPGTLLKFRINGTLAFTRVGSILYYKLDDINKMLEGGMK